MNEELEKRVIPQKDSKPDIDVEAIRAAIPYKALSDLKASKSKVIRGLNGIPVKSDFGVAVMTTSATKKKKSSAKAKLDQTVYILDRQALIKTYITKIVNKQWFDKSGKKKKKKSYVVPDDEVGEQVEKTSFVADDFGKKIWTSQKKAIKAWKKISKYAKKPTSAPPAEEEYQEDIIPSEDGIHPVPEPEAIPPVPESKAQPILKYDPNGGTGSIPWVYFYPGDSIRISENRFTKTGSNFLGWNTAADGSGADYTPGATYILNSNIILYAQWSGVSPEAKATITYNGNGSTGGSVSSVTVTPGSSVNVAFNTFTKNGYVFVNWNTAVDGSGATYVAGKPYDFYKSVTLFAQWDKIKETKKPEVIQKETENRIEPSTNYTRDPSKPGHIDPSSDPIDPNPPYPPEPNKKPDPNDDIEYIDDKGNVVPPEEATVIVRYYDKKGNKVYHIGYRLNKGYYIDENGNIIPPEEVLRYMELYGNASIKDGIQRTSVTDDQPDNIDIDDTMTQI